MMRPRFAAFVGGLAVLAALTVYAGAGAILHAVAGLKLQGLFIVAALHVPVLVLLGLAWWLVARPMEGASRRVLVWARFVREAASEVLPFSQAGGFAIGLRAAHLGGMRVVSAAASMAVDLVTELWAKLPYVAAGLVALAFLAPHAPLLRAFLLAFVLTLAVAALPFLMRGKFWQTLRFFARRLTARWPSLQLAPDDFEAALAKLLSRRGAIAFAFLLHATCWFLGAAETWVIFRLMARPVSPGAALCIDSLVSVLRTFGFLVPAAAGVQEASYVLVGALFAIAPATAVAVSFVRRAREIVVGAPVFALWQYLEVKARAQAA